MQKIARKIFYTGLLRFQLVLFTLVVLPLVAIKTLFIFYPSNFGSIVNVLIIVGVSLAIIGGSIYILFHYTTLDKTLKPLTQMAEVGELAARVAHDLKGPLSSIRAVLSYLQELQTKGQTHSDYFNLLELSSKRLEKIAEDLLKKHKGEEEKRSSFELHEIFDELVGEYSTQPMLSGIRFHKRYADQPIFMCGKRNKIERVFGNIIKNAIEAMNFEGEIIIATKIIQNKAVVNIKDSGPGLSKEKIDKILSGSFTEGKKDGHGIGLTLVKEVLADHGGFLKIESEVGKGCCFQMELPIQDQAFQSFVLEVLKDQTILVIDDDPSILEQWRLKLSELGQKVVVASSYEDFESQNISAEKCQTAVVDYHFENSELNGLEIIQRLKEKRFKNLYLCSGEYWKPSLKKAAKEVGISICPKPLPEIKIQTSDQKTYKVLVIDDEASVRLCWKVIREKLSIDKLYCYPNMESLLAEKVDFKTIDIAFVDKNIRNSDYKGSDVVNYLKLNGVAKVVLASGESEKELRRDPAFSQVDFILNDKIPRSFKEFFS